MGLNCANKLQDMDTSIILEQTVLNLRPCCLSQIILPLPKYLSVQFHCSRHLGGKLGASLVEQLDVEFMDDIRKFSESQLQQSFGEKTG
jgi:hypothetical protein